MLSPQTFHPFPRLATELRLKIWAEYQALTPPSIISIYHLHDSPQRSIKSQCDNWPHIYYKAHAVPPILHVNQEAREFGLTIYATGFSASKDANEEGCWWSMTISWPINGYLTWKHEINDESKATSRHEGFLYWNPEKDIICLEENPTWNELATSVSLWKGTCRVQLPRIRWLLMTDRQMDDWIYNQGRQMRCKTGGRDDIWMGIEAIFILVNRNDISFWYESWQYIDEMYEYQDERAKRWEESLKTWIGGQNGKVPDVELLYSYDPIREVERRLEMNAK